MGRVVLKYVVTQRSKGRKYFYFRHGKFYARLPSPDSPEFAAAYAKYLDRVKNDQPSAPCPPGSFGELVETYLASADYLRLAKSSRTEYRRYLDRMKSMWGRLPARRLTRAAVLEYRDSLQAKPRAASYALQVLRRLLSFGVDRGLLNANPALKPGLSASKSHHKPWSDDNIEAFRNANAEQPMILFVLLLGLCTGQRLGDLIKMTRHDYNGREIAVTQNKTGAKIWVPVHASLKTELDQVNRFMLLESERGKAFKTRNLSRAFLDATRRADLNGLTLHGLRVTSAGWLADAGCSDAELQSILGHQTVAMAAQYRKQSNKKQQASSAIAKLELSRPKV